MNTILIIFLLLNIADLVLVPFIISKSRTSAWVDGVLKTGVSFRPRMLFSGIYKAIILVEIVLIYANIREVTFLVDAAFLAWAWYAVDFKEAFLAITTCRGYGVSNPYLDYRWSRVQLHHHGYSLVSGFNLEYMGMVYNRNKSRFVFDILVIAVICNIL